MFFGVQGAQRQPLKDLAMPAPEDKIVREFRHMLLWPLQLRRLSRTSGFAHPWEALAARLKAAGTDFIIEPHIRFRGKPGEQATMFFLDPSGNALEFKAFADDARVFAK